MSTHTILIIFVSFIAIYLVAGVVCGILGLFLGWYDHDASSPPAQTPAPTEHKSHLEFKPVQKDINYTKCITCGKRFSCGRLRCDGFVQEDLVPRINKK